MNKKQSQKVVIYPQTPQGGLFNSLSFSKSPLGDLGVDSKRGDKFNIENQYFPFRGLRGKK